MKRVLSLLLAIVMVVGLLPVSTFAAGTDEAKIRFETTYKSSMTEDATFTVTAYLENNPGFAAIQLFLEWNDDAVSFEGFNMTSSGKPKLDSELLVDFGPTVNNEEGTIAAADPEWNQEEDGTLFTANFKVIGEGRPEIGLNTDEFRFAKALSGGGYEDIDVIIDNFVFTAPFTAITTDKGPVLNIEQQEDEGDMPYYIVTIPEGATTAYVTAPDQLVIEDLTTHEMKASAYAYVFGEYTEPLYISYDYKDSDDGPVVEIPMNMVASDWSAGTVKLCFLEDEESNLSHVFGIEDAGNACLGLISFRYAEGAALPEPSASYEVSIPTIENGSVTADKTEEVAENEVVTLTVAPKDNTYRLKEGSLTVKLGDTSIEVTAKEGEVNKYTFTMPAGNVTVSAEFELIPPTAYSVTVAAGSNGTVTADKDTAAVDETVTLTVVGATGFELDTLTSNVEGMAFANGTEANTHTFTMPAENVEISATFKQANYTVTVTDTEHGTVTAEPKTAHYGDDVTLTVTADEGYELESLVAKKDGDSNILNANNATSFTMPAGNVTVSATFAAVQQPEEPNEPDISDAPFAIKDKNGEPVSVTVENYTYHASVPQGDFTIQADFAFGLMIGTETIGEGLANTVVVSWDDIADYIENDQLAISVMDPIIGNGWNLLIQYTNNGGAEPEAPASTYGITLAEVSNGTLSAKAGDVDVTADTKFAEGTEITVTATPNAGYALSVIKVNGTSITGNSFTMPAEDVTVTAEFAYVDYTVTVEENLFCRVTADKTENVHIGDTITLTATPDAGYRVKKWMVMNGTSEVTVTADNTFTMPAGNVTVNVYVEKIPYTVTGYTSEQGSVTAAKETASVGDTVNLNVEPAENYVLESLSYTVGEGEAVPINGTSFTMPADNVTIHAVFTKRAFDITVNQPENGGTIEAPEKAAEGTLVQLTVNPAKDYRLVSVKVNGEPIPGTAFTMPAAAVTVSAEFERVYSVSVAEATNCTVKTFVGDSEVTQAAAGETVELVIDADLDAYVLENITVMQGNTPVAYDENYTFTMPEGEVTVKVIFKPANKITEIKVEHDKIETDEETGQMTMNLIQGAQETLDLSFKLDNMHKEGTQIVRWQSDKPHVATVDQNGVVKAVGTGEVIITAMPVNGTVTAMMGLSSDQVLAQITLNVAAPSSESGYTVSLGGDAIVPTGLEVEIPVYIESIVEGVDTFSTYELVFTYDNANLTLLTASDATEGMQFTVDDQNGTVTIRRYGDALNVSVKDSNGDLTNPVLKLRFSGNTVSKSAVVMQSSKVGTSELALTQDAAKAQVVDDYTSVTVSDYTVKLPDEFTGAATVKPGESYSFAAKDVNYNYNVYVSINGGEAFELAADDDGGYTIGADYITGNIIITCEKSGKEVSVSRGPDLKGEDKAYYMTDYTATLDPQDNFAYQIEMTIGGNAYTGYSVQDNVYTIPGADITGDIVIKTNRNALPDNAYSVSFAGNGAGDATGEKTAESGNSYQFTVTEAPGYTYTVTYSMGGEDKGTLTAADGKYTTANVTGNLVITVNKVSNLEVAVFEYIQLDNKTLFLVSATQTLPEGYALSYDGNVMYYTEKYAVEAVEGEQAAETTGEWVYLVFVVEGESFDATAAKAKISSGQNTFTTVEKNCNVNGVGTVDINDAQLVYDMYNKKYEKFASAEDTAAPSVQQFLNADANCDHTVSVQDAAAVVTTILG